MNLCAKCGVQCRDELCLDCRYRGGGRLPDREEDTKAFDLVTRFARKNIRSAFTADQLTQVSPQER